VLLNWVRPYLCTIDAIYRAFGGFNWIIQEFSGGRSECSESQSDGTAPNGMAWSSLAVMGHSGWGRDNGRDGRRELRSWETRNKFEGRGGDREERTVGKRERRGARAGRRQWGMVLCASSRHPARARGVG
jgi:hypothetical protein